MTTPARETQGEGRVLALPLYADHDGAEHIEGTNLALTDIFDANGHCVAETYGRETADALVVAANSIASLAESLAARDARIAELEQRLRDKAADDKIAADLDAWLFGKFNMVEVGDASTVELAASRARLVVCILEAERDRLAARVGELEHQINLMVEQINEMSAALATPAPAQGELAHGVEPPFRSVRRFVRDGSGALVAKCGSAETAAAIASRLNSAPADLAHAPTSDAVTILHRRYVNTAEQQAALQAARDEDALERGETLHGALCSTHGTFNPALTQCPGCSAAQGELAALREENERLRGAIDAADMLAALVDEDVEQGAMGSCSPLARAAAEYRYVSGDLEEATLGEGSR